jgi:hypothetical protein
MAYLFGSIPDVRTAPMTPPLPDFVREFRLKMYRNIHEMVDNETRLYGTESMYGDWNGDLLLLLKDFACSKLIDDRKASGDKRPYRHEPGLETNKRLRRRADRIATSEEPTKCGILYASAAACLLRDDRRMRGSLPARRQVLDFGARVLRRVVLPQMRSLKVIMCMGKEAWECAMVALEVAGSPDQPTGWDAWIGTGRALLVKSRGISLVAAYHPVASKTKDQHSRPWKLVRRLLGR